MRKFFAAWKRFGLWLANAVGLLLFAIIYALVFAPLAAVVKLSGRRFLPRFTGGEKTYCLPKDRIEPTLEYMKRQW